jgi:spermidine synthase
LNEGETVDSPAAGHDIREGRLFLEEPDLGGYYGLAIRIDRVLFEKDTPYQNLVVAEAGPLGRVLFLDGYIQLTEFDETGYHEMMAHVPILTHPDPRRVLIIGGGDGGSLREVLRHPGVARADLCEIDAEVMEASRRYFPAMARSFEDPRASIHIEDGIRFVREHPESWDVILVDSSDPVGPALGLFDEAFYRDLRRALLPGGVAVTQCESGFLFQDLIRDVFRFVPDIFPLAAYYTTLVPTYTSGVIGFAFCSLGPDPLSAPPNPQRLEALGEMDYYTPALHRAAFALPRRFLRLFPPKISDRQGRVGPLSAQAPP